MEMCGCCYRDLEMSQGGVSFCLWTPWSKLWVKPQECCNLAAEFVSAMGGHGCSWNGEGGVQEDLVFVNDWTSLVLLRS